MKQQVDERNEFRDSSNQSVFSPRRSLKFKNKVAVEGKVG